MNEYAVKVLKGRLKELKKDYERLAITQSRRTNPTVEDEDAFQAIKIRMMSLERSILILEALN